MLAETTANIAQRMAGFPPLPELFLLLQRQAGSTHLRHCESSRDNMNSIMLRSPVESTLVIFRSVR
jgi:hypothetical protein